jgi:DNA-binding transcriptional LysR family regulator
MNIRNLETFYWIARLGSFTAAADRVLATQSTVSMRIRELEQSLGVMLFDRSHRTARLTPKGKELVFYVERLIELTTEMQQRITPSESMSGLIRVGVVEIIAYTWLPRFIRTLRDKYPNIALELEIALTAELVDKLANGALDVIFALGNPPNENYVCESLGSIQLEWMANPALGIPSGTVAPKELERWPFITLNQFSYHHTTVQSWMKKNQVRCRKVIVCNSMTVAATLVAAGVGISLLPPVCYRREMKKGTLQIVRTTGRMRPVEFSAMYPIGEFQPLAPLVTDLAVQVSDLDVENDDGGVIALPRQPREPSHSRRKKVPKKGARAIRR